MTSSFRLPMQAMMSLIRLSSWWGNLLPPNQSQDHFPFSVPPSAFGYSRKLRAKLSNRRLDEERST